MGNNLTSFELSNKLKRLGVEQNSTFYYDRKRNVFFKNDLPLGSRTFEKDFTAAFSSDELNSILPAKIKNDVLRIEAVQTDELNFLAGYVESKKLLPSYSFKKISKTEADAKAKLLIELILNNIIK